MSNDFLVKDDLNLFISGSRVQIATVILKEKMEKDVATFDLFVKEMVEELKRDTLSGEIVESEVEGEAVKVNGEKVILGIRKT